MTKQFDWQKVGHGFQAAMPDEVTLVVYPDATQGFGTKAKRGTVWRAQASQWDAPTRTMSRFGRDEYGTARKTFKDAMRAAEAIYLDTTA